MYQLVCGFTFVVFLAVFQINGRIGCKDQLKRTQETLEIKEKQIHSLEAKEAIYRAELGDCQLTQAFYLDSWRMQKDNIRVLQMEKRDLEALLEYHGIEYK